uniref:fumarylacetoacetase n=1 Tax=mine drainage metagenome TaxID=410659 RepID=E6PDS7_9ZZZZ
MSVLDLDASHDPKRTSWIEVGVESDFPIQNLPYGIFSAKRREPRIGVAIGERIVDLRALAEAGLFDGIVDRATLSAETLNALMAAGRPVWRALRGRVSDLLRVGGDRALLEMPQALASAEEATMHLPAIVGDYVDFYSSIEHATNLGRLFRPQGEPLLPNWRWIPIGYHGRSATIVPSGTPIRRPRGQRRLPGDEAPVFGASTRLDIELEVGFFAGPGNALGESLPIERAREHIFGSVLVNDWSARDIQAWEYQPLGPFLGKSFATTISPWVVTMEALEPFRVAGPTQIPAPLPYLQRHEPDNYEIALSVLLSSAAMRARGIDAAPISSTSFAGMYWSQAQQLAHAASNGAAIRPGDLFASGTISGTRPGSQGSLIELTENGANPLQLPDGEERAFLEDGDEVRILGRCLRDGFRSIGFGSACGRVLSAVREPMNFEKTGEGM